jgi:phage shock protein PspC (stress-responsive transcriptional regulator)
MNKVITVNLNGNAYQVEESGYAALDGYLADAEAKLKDNPDLREIMADLEQAIADKCNKHLTPAKTVINKSEIDQILNEMGPVDPHAAEGAEDPSEEPRRDRPRPESASPKRLYRIREGSMIAGVCKGLAAYFNVDVTLVRLAFAICALASAGAFVLAYFAAMIVIPPADTFEEQAEAHGKPFNAQELVDQARKHYADFKKDTETWWRKTGSPDWEKFKQNMPEWKRKMKDMPWETHRAARQARPRSAPRAPAPCASPQVDYASHVLSMVMFPIFGLVMAALTVVWILAIISVLNTGAVFGWPLPVAVPLWAAILVLIALYSALIGPFKIALQGRGYIHEGRYYGWPSVLGGLVWLGCMILAFVIAYAYVPEVREFVENLPSALSRLVRR